MFILPCEVNSSLISSFLLSSFPLALKRMSTQSTPTVWSRLRKSKSAMAGLIIISGTVLAAIFTYVVAPDTSPYANRQVVEIGRKKPGDRQQFLLLPKERQPQRTGFFDGLLNGKEEAYRYLPISNYRIKKDSIIVGKYVDDGITGTAGIRVTQYP